MKKLLTLTLALCAFFSSILWANEPIGLTGTDDGYTVPKVGLTSWQMTELAEIGSYWPTESRRVVCQPVDDSPAQPDIVGKIIPSLRPWSQCSEFGWKRNMMRYLITGEYFDMNGPEGLNFVTYVFPWELAKTRDPFYRNMDLASFRGCSERGTKISGVLRLQSETPFNPKDLNVKWYTTKDFPGMNLFSAEKYGFNHFSDIFVGYHWGPDGIRNTEDDLEFRSGPTVPVNELYYTGVWGGTDLSLKTLEQRVGDECFFVKFHYWVEQNKVVRFDQTVEVPVYRVPFTFPSIVGIARSKYDGWTKVGVDPGGMRGFLYWSTDLVHWEKVEPEPLDPGWYYIRVPEGEQVFFQVWAE